jgi:hypothetical protein
MTTAFPLSAIAFAAILRLLKNPLQNLSRPSGLASNPTAGSLVNSYGVFDKIEESIWRSLQKKCTLASGISFNICSATAIAG